MPPRAALACLVLCLAVAAGLVARAATADREVREWVPASGQGEPGTGVAQVDAGTGAPSADPAGTPAGAPAGAPATGTQSGTQSGAPQATPGAVLVHVVGAVRRPGVVSLPAGARVADAVTAAGGATRRAELAAVNLARPVVDGEQLWVPARGETVPPGGASGSAGGSAGGAAPGSPGGSGAPARVNLNTADAATLDTLPGVGPVLAGRILQWRTANGRFTSVDELAEVQGIGDRLLEGLRDLVTVS